MEIEIVLPSVIETKIKNNQKKSIINKGIEIESEGWVFKQQDLRKEEKEKKNHQKDQKENHSKNQEYGKGQYLHLAIDIFF